jgi:hypothetical protein
LNTGIGKRYKNASNKRVLGTRHKVSGPQTRDVVHRRTS